MSNEYPTDVRDTNRL